MTKTSHIQAPSRFPRWLKRQRVIRPGRSQLFVLAGAAVIIGALFFFSASTRAKFETPAFNPKSIPTTDFLGVWGYQRASSGNYDVTSLPNPTLLAPTKNYAEQWAVGQSSGNGVVYYYDGNVWNNVTGTNTASLSNNVIFPIPQLNAVAGQFIENYGFAQMWFAGDNGTMIYSRNYDALGAPYSPSGALPEYKKSSLIDLNGTDIAGTPFSVYAVAANQINNGNALAGGEGGRVFKHRQFCSGINGCTSAYPNNDVWQQIQPKDSGGTDITLTGQAVTGIAFSRNGNPYVVTSTFSGGKLDRTCTGPHTGQLWRVQYSSGSGQEPWTLLGTIPTCVYGVSVGLLDTAQANNGPLHNKVWVAAADGVYQYDESAGSLVKIYNSSKTLYSVATSPIRQGSGKNLLYNGNFEAWQNANPTGSTVNPSGWEVTDDLPGPDKSANTTKCFTNTKDIVIGQGRGGPGDHDVVVEPGLYYKTTDNPLTTNCDPNGNIVNLPAVKQTDATAAAYQRIDLSNYEGSKFKISGWYQVTFPVGATPPNPYYFPQGGVALHCDGTTVGKLGSLVPSIDCAYENTSNIVNADTGGWKQFSIIVSKEDTQLNDPLQGGNTGSLPSKSGTALQVWCEATYGAQASCDDLSVERVDDPSAALVATSTWAVTAAGDGTLISNPDVVANPANFSLEGLPDATAQLYSVAMVGSQQAAVGGKNSALYQRLSGNLSGGIWVGLSAPKDFGSNIAAGWIQANCLKSKDAFGRTICNLVQESFGLSFDETSGVLSGRAWFGKQYGSGRPADDKETVSLGSAIGICSNNSATSCSQDSECGAGNTCIRSLCVGAARKVSLFTSNPGQPYLMTGSCNQATRTCDANPAKTCRRDFDCYGRCAQNAGFLCLYNSDCETGLLGGPSSPNGTDISGSRLTTLPTNRLTCGVDLQNGSPQACTSSGWLNFDPSLYLSTARPPGFGVSSDKNYCTANGGACYTAVGNTSGGNLAGGNLRGWGQFSTLANSNDDNALHCDGDPAKPLCTVATQSTDCASHVCAPLARGWVSLRGNPKAPVGTLYGCQACDTKNGNMNCAFCQDSNNQSCKPLQKVTSGTCSLKPSLSCSSDANCAPSNGSCIFNASNSACHFTCVGGAKDTKACVTKDSSDCADVCIKNANPPHCTQKVILGCSSDADCSGTCAPIGKCSRDGTTCSTDADCPNKGYCDRGAVCTAASGNSCTQYGVNFDSSSQKFSGWAWSPDYGWLDFHYLALGTSRYVQALLGDIYAAGTIGNPSGQSAPSCNATYLITSEKNITNFCTTFSSSVAAITPAESNTTTRLPATGERNIYTNVLGRVDLVGLTKDVGSGQNKYGSPIVPLSTLTSDFSTSWNAALAAHGSALNNNVYVLDSGSPSATYTLGQAVTIFNGTYDSGTKLLQNHGAGVLVVNGSLVIKSALSYAPGPISDLRQLASLVVIVKGDLIVDNAVSALTGTFYVRGNFCTTNGNTTDTKCDGSDLNPPPSPLLPSYASGAANSLPLEVNGLVIAQKFGLGRTYAGTIANPAPSELFILDGHLQTNPPAGLVDFANSLPNTIGSGP